MTQEDKFITTKEFISIIARIYLNKNSKRRIFFILGAGASVEAEIPGAGMLAGRWLKEMKESNESGCAKFILDNEIDENAPANWYSKIYQERFKDDPDERWEYMESVIDNKTPNYGYSVLSQIVGDSHHNVIITTNFDHLAEQSIHTFSGKTPLVCGHESLAHFARPSNTRPLIIKVHNDLLFAPKSEEAETQVMTEAWEKSFTTLFNNCDQTVLVAFGYGGNDGSLMGFLKKIAKPSNLFWCLYKEETPSDETLEMMRKHDGKFVRTDGFDKIMLLLQNELKLELIADKIEKNAKQNAENFRKTYEKLSKEINLIGNEELKTAQKEITKKVKDTSSFYYFVQASSAETDDEKEKLYKEGLSKFPNDTSLLCDYAWFLYETSKDYDNAEKLYKKALEIDPDNSINLGSYAILLSDIRKDYDNAEKLYKKALKIDPDNSINTGNYANFLSAIRKDFGNAEKLYKKALEIDPDNANNLANYGQMLLLIGKAHDALNNFKLALGLAKQNSIRLEIYFYYYANYPELRESALTELIHLIKKGTRSIEWDFSGNIELAEREGHPDLLLLKKLAAIITEDAPADDL